MESELEVNTFHTREETFDIKFIKTPSIIMARACQYLWPTAQKGLIGLAAHPATRDWLTQMPGHFFTAGYTGEYCVVHSQGELWVHTLGLQSDILIALLLYLIHPQTACPCIRQSP